MGISVRKLSHALWGITASYYSPKLRDACRKIPGMTWGTAPHHSQGVGYADAVDAVIERLKTEGIAVARGELPTRALSEHQLLVAESNLRPYQVEGVDFLIANAQSGALLADDLGLGKTLQAITVARAFKTKTLIACLSYVKGVWESELKKWWPKVVPYVATLEGVRKTDSIDDGVQIVIANYDILHAWVECLTAWQVRGLIIDEVHVAANEKSRRTKALREIRKHCHWCVGTSGTPMTNRPKDLWSVVNTISPGRFGDSFFPYGLMFCAGHKEEIEVRGE